MSPPLPEQTTPEGADEVPPLRILCVDDNRDVADSTTTLLRVVGFEARACYSGEHALAEAAAFQPGACLIDLNMPGMDGDELAARLREVLAGRPVVLVAMTAMNNEESARRIQNAGFDVYLVKPVDPQKLLTVVDGLWHMWQDALTSSRAPSRSRSMIPPELIALAPTALANLRPARFDGTGSEVSLARFAPEDRTLLNRLYAVVQGLPAIWSRTQPNDPALAAYIREAGALMADASRLGTATRAAGREDEAVRKALHDIRGGGLSVLLGTADLLAMMPEPGDLVRQCVDAARDHAKIMRNLLPDIDPPVREADEAVRAHGIGHFTSKWDGTAVNQDGRTVTVRVRCSFAGDISARCLETSSIDRVIYNYVNNAVRFATDGRVTLWIFPVGLNLIRWVVQNQIAADQAAFLAGQAPDLDRLYAGGVTRGGTGVGLTNCAEIVAECFGLDSPAQAVTGRYLGAKTDGTDYLAWFHWPTYTPATAA